MSKYRTLIGSFFGFLVAIVCGIAVASIFVHPGDRTYPPVIVMIIVFAAAMISFYTIRRRKD